MGNILNSGSSNSTPNKLKPNNLKSKKKDIDSFLKKVKQTPKTPALIDRENGRVIFAMDATASRQPSWDRACHYQVEMFNATQNCGGLSVQICYYRGYGEFEASTWLSNSKSLQHTMAAVFCLGGFTQINKVLQHALEENKCKKVSAVIFIGDAIEEDPAKLRQIAGQLGMLKVPVFVFQEGNDRDAAETFKQIAKLSGGAYSLFDPGSASILADLLGAVAVYATGGSTALSEFSQLKSSSIKQLLQQLE
ncbi:MAG: hypothetical protein KUG82_05020 [Pseudomonadales bacterium]|nr:hypothetical protein [Pseudomonadales bacterium]